MPNAFLPLVPKTNGAFCERVQRAAGCRLVGGIKPAAQGNSEEIEKAGRGERRQHHRGVASFDRSSKTRKVQDVSRRSFERRDTSWEMRSGRLVFQHQRR